MTDGVCLNASSQLHDRDNEELVTGTEPERSLRWPYVQYTTFDHMWS